jgi:zinc protease
MTKPRWNEADFKTWFDKTKAAFSNLSSEPRKAFADTVAVMMANHHYRSRPINSESLNEITFEKLKSIYNDRFNGATGFTFIFTGALKPEEAKPFIEKYLASIPVTKRVDKYKDNGERTPKGKTINDFKKANKTPRTSISVVYNIPCKYSAEDLLMLATIRHCLELRYTQKIREEKGGTYSVGVINQFNEFPETSCNLRVIFDTDPKLADELVAIVHDQIKVMIENGPTEADLQKAKEYFIKARQENLKDNTWWSGTLTDFYFHKADVLTGYEDMVKKLTLKSVQDYAKKNLSKANIIDVYMRPL